MGYFIIVKRAFSLFSINVVVIVALVGFGLGVGFITQIRFDDIRQATSLDQPPVSVLGRCDGERPPDHPSWCLFENKQGELVVLMDDSHAIALSAGILAATQDHGLNLLVIGEVACQINATVDDLTCQELNRIRIDYALQTKPKAVLLADRYFDSQPSADGIAPVISQLTTGGTSTIMFQPIPTVAFDPRVSWIRPNPKSTRSPLDHQLELEVSARQLQDALIDDDSVQFIETAQTICK